VQCTIEAVFSMFSVKNGDLSDNVWKHVDCFVSSWTRGAPLFITRRTKSWALTLHLDSSRRSWANGSEQSKTHFRQRVLPLHPQSPSLPINVTVHSSQEIPHPWAPSKDRRGIVIGHQAICSVSSRLADFPDLFEAETEKVPAEKTA
jgi:hypothetical protein